MHARAAVLPPCALAPRSTHASSNAHVTGQDGAGAVLGRDAPRVGADVADEELQRRACAGEGQRRARTVEGAATCRATCRAALIRVGVACAMRPTSSSACMSFLIRAARGALRGLMLASRSCGRPCDRLQWAVRGPRER